MLITDTGCYRVTLAGAMGETDDRCTYILTECSETVARKDW